ncbi:unnamed protein product [Rotaria sordida]|uniref:LTD domain-containing protein n=1 Tax=Rotaria sordida TaxID=392033 RepID=A0A818NZW3_9BILA|nr:unnamed protein product [Rotaria sordida]
MSSDSRIVIMDENKKNENIVATYHRRDVQFDSAPSYTSSLVVHLRQLQQDFQTQHQHEKHALNELNERLRHFIDRVQHLEAQNAKYITQIVNFRRARSDFSGADIEWNERYLHLQSDLIAASHGSIDFGLEIEMYQLQTAIYQQLIGLEHEWKDERRSKLEQELNQSSLTLNSVRASNSELGREVESLYAARECPPDGAYISLLNHSSEKTVDISRWVLKRRIDGRTELRYSLPDGIRLQPASELRIYSQQGAAVAKSLKSFRTGTSGRQELVNNEVVSWGVGNSTETFLLNQHGEEKAIFSQSIAATPDNS